MTSQPWLKITINPNSRINTQNIPMPSNRALEKVTIRTMLYLDLEIVHKEPTTKMSLFKNSKKEVSPSTKESSVSTLEIL